MKTEQASKIKTIDFTGTYFKNGNKILNKNNSLTLLERKSTSSKPKYYLMCNVNGKSEYLSSLFQLDENEFMFDNRAKKYKWLEKQGKIYISEI